MNDSIIGKNINVDNPQAYDFLKKTCDGLLILHFLYRKFFRNNYESFGQKAFCKTVRGKDGLKMFPSPFDGAKKTAYLEYERKGEYSVFWLKDKNDENIRIHPLHLGADLLKTENLDSTIDQIEQEMDIFENYPIHKRYDVYNRGDRILSIPKIPVGNSVFSGFPNKLISISELIDLIKHCSGNTKDGDSIKLCIDAVRQNTQKWMSETDKAKKKKFDAYRKLWKNKLPYIIWGAITNYRSVSYIYKLTGLMCLDIDKIYNKEELLKLKDRISKDEGLDVVAIFISPSGYGLKVVIYSDIAKTGIDYKEYYESNRIYLKEKYPEYKENIDTTQDAVRACFVSSDPEIYYSEECFYIDYEFKFDFNTYREKYLAQDRNSQKEYKKRVKGIDKMSKNSKVIQGNNDTSVLVNTLVDRIENASIDLTEDRKDWMIIAFSLSSFLGEEGLNYFLRISQFYPDYNEDEATDFYLEKCESNNGHYSIGSFITLATNALKGVAVKSQMSFDFGDSLSDDPKKKRYNLTEYSCLGKWDCRINFLHKYVF